MVTLPGLDQYSESDRRIVFKQSPISAHYYQLLQRKPANPNDYLRLDKHQHWLRCSFATALGHNSAEDICSYWSEQTERILLKSWRERGWNEEEIAILAFGKLGSRELNLSSDVDLVFVRTGDPTNNPWISSVKKWIQDITETSLFGFAYRIDLNLRPGGDTSPLIPTQTHFFNYYDEYIEAWNRLSFIRLRPLTQGSSLNQDILDYTQRLCFPRRLDFSIVNEIKGLRSKLQFQWRRANEPLDIKFHPGGIRDIELYIHALQVIYAGRNPTLQTSSMSKAFDQLHTLKILTDEHYHFLKKFYWQLRELENRIHTHDDKQTYRLRSEILPNEHEFAHEKNLIAALKNTEEIVHHFFSEESETISKKPTANPQTPILPDELSPRMKAAYEDILNMKGRALQKGENDRLKNEILNTYTVAINHISIDQDLALELFRDFMSAIRSKSSFFHLLHRHPELLENLAWLFSISPYMGQILCRRPELMDSFVLGRVSLDDSPDTETLLENLIDYKLLGQWLGVIYLLKKKDNAQFHLSLSLQADQIASRLLSSLQNNMGCSPFKLLCMGKWSGFEIGVHSDLDFVFITDHTPQPEQVKVARRFITLLTTPTKAQKLFDIDMRLKPDQNSGPLLIEQSELISFLKTKALGWHKLAYLRSRLIQTDTMYFKDQLQLLKLNSHEADELNTVRNKLLQTGSNHEIDIKYHPGGLVDTELAIQQHILVNQIPITQTSTVNLIEASNTPQNLKEKLKKNYIFLRQFEQILQITQDSSRTKVSVHNPNLHRIQRILHLNNPFAELQDVLQSQVESLKSLT